MKILTGNDLVSGDVIWWAGDGWSRQVGDSIDVGQTGDDLARTEEAAGGGEGEARVMRLTQRQRAHELLAPARYHARWRFLRVGDDGVSREGGIPLAELEASAVRDPGPDGQLWLLHKKVFRMVRNSRGELVADANQKVPICVGCNAALSRKVPTMPK